MGSLNVVALAILIVGGLNWGLVGLFNFNLVAAIFGTGSVLSTIVYLIVGAAALYCLTLFTYVSRDTATVRRTS